MPPVNLHVLADDLSGAAECAAALAMTSCQPAPLVLSGPLPSTRHWALDIDSRAMPATAAADLAARALREAGAGGAALLFKKIDSTLRGNLAAEVRAMLAMRDLTDAVVVCPTLPSQGRTLHEGVLHIYGQPQLADDGRPLDLLKLLAVADPERRLLRPRGETAAELAAQIVASVRAGARILVVDAASDGDLCRLAQALVVARDGCRLLAAGAAGLARALADELVAPAQPAVPAPGAAREGSLVAVVGSFNSVTGRQVEEVAAESDVHLVRLNASLWLTCSDQVASELSKAEERAADGKSIVLTATGTMPVQSNRELVRCMAAAAEPLIRRAAILVLTGGDTARTVLDRLGVQQLQVWGELEPGICLSRNGADAPVIVTKAGGFGDNGSLLRVLRHFRSAPDTNTARERKE